MSASTPFPTLAFRLLAQGPVAHFGPRLGIATVTRPQGQAPIQFHTPCLLACSSRGVVPHLSSDNIKITPSLEWVHIPFESFLETSPPVVTQQPGPSPLHTFLGFSPDRHILSISLRDPADDREMPPNGNNYLSCSSVRGVHKVTPSDYQSYILSLIPDVIIAMSDIPFIPPSLLTRKRLTKGIDRSLSWLASALKVSAQNVIVHMVGSATIPAREAFAVALREPIIQQDKDGLENFSCLDDGVAGYAFNLIPMRNALSSSTSLNQEDDYQLLKPLFVASLASLSPIKLRLVHTTNSPHDILFLIRDIGIDLFDSHWAQKAADWGVALDFTFPAPVDDLGLRPVGHNLYEERYAFDFAPLTTGDSWPNAPSYSTDPLLHSDVDSIQWDATIGTSGTPFSRAYIHHLLHTHEMSGHSLLVMHNFAVLNTFFRGIQKMIREITDSGLGMFEQEVDRFMNVYDKQMHVLKEASKIWREVDLARGKGRLAREKATNGQMLPE